MCTFNVSLLTTPGPRHTHSTHSTHSTDGAVPVDGMPREQLVTILQPLVIVYYCLATIGLIFAFVCLLFNFIFRNRK